MNLALIPLRGGSKSIPGKNIKPIAGKPLCAWVLGAACDAELFSKIIVSTDCENIGRIASSINSNIEILMRPSKISADNSPTELAMLHAASNFSFQLLTTIQATSPLTTANDFIEAHELFRNQSLDSLVTGTRVNRFFWNKFGSPINYNPAKRPMRQDIEGLIMENGAFYITKRDILKKTECRLGGLIGVYEMPAENAIEIDEQEDWGIAERLLIQKRIIPILKQKNIKLLAIDCDGVLTDAGMYYGENGEEYKKFNTRDGHGLSLLKANGIKTAVITSEKNMLVKNRAIKIGIDDLHMGIKDKRAVIFQLADKYNIKPECFAYIGDDINDLSAIEVVGFSFAVNDAVYEVKNKADYILTQKGGKGAVREACDLIMTSICN